MPDKINWILSEMTKIYTMFCLPRISVNTKTHDVSIENVWINGDAEESYKKLEELLLLEKIKEEKTIQEEQDKHSPSFNAARKAGR